MKIGALTWNLLPLHVELVAPNWLDEKQPSKLQGLQGRNDLTTQAFLSLEPLATPNLIYHSPTFQARNIYS